MHCTLLTRRNALVLKVGVCRMCGEAFERGLARSVAILMTA